MVNTSGKLFNENYTVLSFLCFRTSFLETPNILLLKKNSMLIGAFLRIRFFDLFVPILGISKTEFVKFHIIIYTKRSRANHGIIGLTLLDSVKTFSRRLFVGKITPTHFFRFSLQLYNAKEINTILAQ